MQFGPKPRDELSGGLDDCEVERMSLCSRELANGTTKILQGDLYTSAHNPCKGSSRRLGRFFNLGPFGSNQQCLDLFHRAAHPQLWSANRSPV